MKQNLRFILLTLLCAVVTGAWGEKIDFSQLDYENGQEVTTVDGEDFSVTFDKGTNSNTPKYYTTGTAIRVYGGGNFTVNSTKNITKIVISFGEGDNGENGNNPIAANEGSYSNGTWTGSASEVKFTVGGTSGNRRIKAIEVTFGEAPSVSAPTFTPAGGTYSEAQTVTISCATEGATIFYTLDGTDPDNGCDEYESPLTIESTTTIKAIAYKDGESSSIASATYTIVSPKTIAEVRAQATGNVYTKGVVTSKIEKTAYIQDETAGICVYGDSPINVGDEITVQGTLTTYKGLLEITNPTCTVLSSGNEVAPVVKTIDEINSDYSGSNALQGMLVKIEEATVTAIDKSNTTIQQDDETIVVRGISGVEVKVGDIITLTGNVGCFNAAQIANPTDIIVKESEEPSITLDNNTINFGQEGGSETLTPTFNNFTPEEFEVFFYEADGETTATYDWINLAIADNIVCSVEANDGEERTAYFKVYALSGDNEVYSELVTVTQEAYEEPAAEFATLPFEFDGGKADIEGTDGLTQEGLGSDYKNSPYLKFDGTGDWVLLQFDERPGILTFDIQGNSFSGSTFTVQTSEDGETFTDLKAYTELGSTQSEEFNNLGENVRYIKWVYTEKDGGNVALGNIKLAQYTEPTKYVLTITNVENATITATDADGNEITSDSEVLAGTDINLTVDVAEGYTLEALSVTKADESEVSVTENDGTWSFTMPSSNVTVTCTVNKAEEPGDEEWVKTNLADLTSDDVFVIVGDNGETYAMSNNGGASSAPSAIKVSITDDKITSKVADNIKWNISGNAEDGYTFYPNGNEEAWLYTTNTNNGVRVGTNDNKVFTIEDGYLKNNATSRYVGIYNSQDWRCYTGKDGNINNQTFAFYKLVEPVEPVEDVTLIISEVGYATLFYSDRNLVVPEGVTAYTYTANENDIEVLQTFNPGDVIPKACGVVLEAENQGTEQEFTFELSDTDAEADEGNLLYGLDNGGMTVGPDGTDNYTFFMLSLDKNNENVGFYYGAKKGVAFEALPHKAYLAIPKPNGINATSFTFDDLNGIKGIESDSIMERGEVYTLSGIRVNGNQLPKGIYIVNGKKVVIK